jgi:hypothetical protein
MARKKKTFDLTVTVSVPAWMTKAEARREVRTLINHQCNYMTGKAGPGPFEFHYLGTDDVRARRVR